MVQLLQYGNLLVHSLQGQQLLGWSSLGGLGPSWRRATCDQEGESSPCCRRLGLIMALQPASSKNLIRPTHQAHSHHQAFAHAVPTSTPALKKLARDRGPLLLWPQARSSQAQDPADTYVESHTASVTSFWKELSLPEEGGAEMSLVGSHQELEQAGYMWIEVQKGTLGDCHQS